MNGKHVLSSQLKKMGPEETWPTPRFGHSFDKLCDNTFLLIGGNNMPFRHLNLPNASNIFHTEPVSDIIYTYDSDNNYWQNINTDTELGLKRSFHATSDFTFNEIKFVIVSGGITFDDSWKSLPMSKTFLIKINNNKCSNSAKDLINR